MKTALTIGGSDPSGGAGLQADLKTFKALGVYGLSVPSSLTAQNTTGIKDIQTIDTEFFTKQLDTVLEDFQPDALKTGMLYSRSLIIVTAEKIRNYSLQNLVIDPVSISSTGVNLLQKGASDALKDHLLPLARVATPNLEEASLLTGMRIQNENDMKKAAEMIMGLGSESVIITGGHNQAKTTDLLFDGRDFLFLQRERISGDFHGTGCVFSSAVTASLALRYDVREAAINANDFVWKSIRSAVSIGKGMKILDI
jgi:hydroxymethylpyrimidine/phosphomethylpyrimidine kinase